MISKVVHRDEDTNVTVFGFDAGQELTEHRAARAAVVQVITGRLRLPERLRSLRFHDLRHTYASLLVEQGAHPKEMAEVMGHSSVQITLDRYSHVMPHMTSTLAERLDATYRKAAPVLPAAGERADVLRLS